MENLTKGEILVIKLMDAPLYFEEIVNGMDLDSESVSDVIDRLIEKGIMREVN